MRRIIYFLVACTCCFIVSAYDAGPGTNGFELTGAETGGGSLTNGGCHCHSALATPGIEVTIQLDSAGIATAHYTGGMTYTVKLTGTNNLTSTLPKFGFQIGSIVGVVPATAPVNAGTWEQPLPANTHFITPFSVGVVEHSTAINATTGNGGNGSTYEQTFNWQAPAAGTGAISIWAALNAVNGNDNLDMIDKWDTAHIIINEWSSALSALSFRHDEFAMNIFPNPVSTDLNLIYTLDNMSRVSLELFDLNGQCVVTILHQVQYAGVKRINFPIPAGLPKGIYALRASVNDKPYLKRVIINR